MSKKKKKGVIKWVIVGVLAAGAVTYFGFGEKLGIRKSSGETLTRQQQMMQASTSEAEVVRGDIHVTTEGSGSIEAAEKIVEYADFPMLVAEVIAENGDLVQPGDVIAKLDEKSVREQLRAARQQLTSMDDTIRNTSYGGSENVTSSVKGRVKRIFCEKGDLLSDITAEKGGIMEIAADGKLEVTVQLDPASQLALHTGQDIRVRIDGEEEDGYISELDEKTCTVVFEDRASYSVDDEATVTDTEGRIIGSGQILTHSPYLVQADYGTVSEVKVEQDDYVESGTVLVSRKFVSYTAAYQDLLKQRNELLENLQELRRLEKDPVITANEEGILCDLTLAEGGSTMKDGAMFAVISTESYNLKAQIDELDIAGVEEGQQANIVFDALEDETFEGVVTKVSRLGNNTNGVTTYTVTIEVPGSEQMKTNMSATATIIIDSSEDTLVIPVDAVQTDDGTKYVNVVTEEGSERRPVILGLVNNTEAEVLEGLSEGEKIIVIGTSELEDMMNMMRGGRRNRDNSEDNG